MEQRKQTRKKVRFSFRYLTTVAPSGEKAQDGTVVDLTDQGIRFETGEKLPVGTKLRVQGVGGKAKDDADPVARDGVVVWSIQPDPGVQLYRVGVKYI
ncbi:MAG: PilZ domain-containing protein [bacterium]|nr:PilZ domain-containing protein [bacterium]